MEIGGILTRNGTDKILPVIVGTGQYVPPTIMPIYEAVIEDVGMNCMHTYISFSKLSDTPRSS